MHEPELSLYTTCFTGKAKRTRQYDCYLSTAHRTEDCSLPNDEDPDVENQLRNIKSAVVALIVKLPQLVHATLRQPGEVCKIKRGECISIGASMGIYLCAMHLPRKPPSSGVPYEAPPSQSDRPDGENISPQSNVSEHTHWGRTELNWLQDYLEIQNTGHVVT